MGGANELAKIVVITDSVSQPWILCGSMLNYCIVEALNLKSYRILNIEVVTVWSC